MPQRRCHWTENWVLIFAIEHMKGLKFAAVFFLGLDDPAEKEPELFDKYLYLGATRAATYLRLICSNHLLELGFIRVTLCDRLEKCLIIKPLKLL